MVDYKKIYREITKRLGFEPREDLVGEYVYFESNPSDPNLSHDMASNRRFQRDVVFQGETKLTKEMLEKIVREVIPTSIGWSRTEKKIICSTLPCPCCSISMYVEVVHEGFYTGEKDTEPISGLL